MPDAKQALCFALDVPGAKEAETMVKLLAPYVGLFKVGLELFVREGPPLLSAIHTWGAERIFLDLKFHDIPRTVRQAQQSAGHLPVDFLSVHCESLSTSPKGLETWKDEALPDLLGITVLTSVDEARLSTLGYSEKVTLQDLVLLRAEIAFDAGCAGVVCSGKEVAILRKRFGSGFLLLTPGVRPEWQVVKGDDQARVFTPYKAISSGADFIVVGRPIHEAPSPAEAAEKILEEIEKGIKDR